MVAFNLMQESESKKETLPRFAMFVTLIFAMVGVTYTPYMLYDWATTTQVQSTTEPSSNYKYTMAFTCDCAYGCVYNSWGDCTAQMNGFLPGNRNTMTAGETINMVLCASASDYLVFAADSNATVIDVSGQMPPYQLYGKCLPSTNISSDTNFANDSVVHIGHIESMSIDLPIPWGMNAGHGVMKITPTINKVKHGTSFAYIPENTETLSLFKNRATVPCYSLWGDLDISDCQPIQLGTLVFITTAMNQTFWTIIGTITGTLTLIYTFLFQFLKFCRKMYEKYWMDDESRTINGNGNGNGNGNEHGNNSGNGSCNSSGKCSPERRGYTELLVEGGSDSTPKN